MCTYYFKGPDYLSKKSSGFVLRKIFCRNYHRIQKMKRKMYGPAVLFFEIINFEWNHVFAVFAKIWPKVQLTHKFITQKLIKLWI